MTHFDGEGNLAQVDSLIINGAPVSDWSPVTGTYHVNASTGTMSLLPSAGGFVNLRIVVVRHGMEIHTVVWPPFDGPNRTVTSVGAMNSDFPFSKRQEIRYCCGAQFGPRFVSRFVDGSRVVT
jgi:hypothetical protein